MILSAVLATLLAILLASAVLALFRGRPLALLIAVAVLAVVALLLW